MAITTNPLKAQLTSISVQGQDIQNPTNTFLARKINDFVQSEFFKTAAGSESKGTYRLVKTGDTLTLEKKEGENWKKIQPPAPNPDADDVSSTSSDDTSIDTPNDELKKWKDLIGHFEHAAQKPVRSKFANNSCFLDAPYALLANIPSLRETVLNTQNLPDTAKGLADSSSIKNGKDIRACFPDNQNIQTTRGGDPRDLLDAVLKPETKLAKIDVIFSEGQLPIIQELNRLDETHRSTLTSIQNGFPHKHLVLSSATSEGQTINFDTLLTNFQEQKTIPIPADFAGRGERDYNYRFNIDYSKPIWIEINRKNDGSTGKDIRPLTNVQLELENDGNKLHLKGFIVHKSSADSSGAHYVAYYRKLNIETGEYQWWKDNDLEDSAETVADDSITKLLEQATHLYYDNDFYEDTTDNDDAISVISAESFESARDE